MEGFLTCDQLAARLGVEIRSLYRMRYRGDLPEATMTGRTPLWPVAVIEEWERNRPGRGWRKSRKRAATDQ